MSDNPLTPSMALLCKIGSILTHVEESMSPGAHDFDLIAMKSALNDPEVQRWLGEMGSRALIPVKRPAEDLNKPTKKTRSRS